MCRKPCHTLITCLFGLDCSNVLFFISFMKFYTLHSIIKSVYYCITWSVMGLYSYTHNINHIYSSYIMLLFVLLLINSLKIVKLMLVWGNISEKFKCAIQRQSKVPNLRVPLDFCEGETSCCSLFSNKSWISNGVNQLPSNIEQKRLVYIFHCCSVRKSPEFRCA